MEILLDTPPWGSQLEQSSFFSGDNKCLKLNSRVVFFFDIFFATGFSLSLFSVGKIQLSSFTVFYVLSSSVSASFSFYFFAKTLS